MGILTGALAMLFVNWQAFNGSPELEQARCILMFMVILMIFLNLMIGGSKNEVYNTDTYGHLGGAIAGLFWGLAVFPRVKNHTSAKLRMVGIGLTLGFFLLCSLLLVTKQK
jgi:membrane associated rhomboid family serine protease